ncbi:hypothetical protein SLNSH_13760 [Alsobacter soli]|uniref:Peptidoglycan binding-like domain-containing protein n=1 Tax=Alsobacter soli TaxID=2109933 RepID=A0A2T1HSE3_9HYPH|nr:peptidoglycan-binding domain-containing protein [Alsobacter soli]PSC04557.1 hypothetical protein SLNSH_13760 [Alsobacter soli]
MPEVLARTDHDFVLSQERRPRKASARSRRKPARAAWLTALFRNPGTTIVGAASAAIAVGVVVNALALQSAPHPAPFFGRAGGEVVKLSGFPAVLPPTRPTDLGPATTASVTPAEPTKAAARAASPAQPIPQPIPRGDVIGDMLRGGAPAAAEISKPVLNAQKALNKLGYGPVKIDGVFGSGTRQALERFERDHKLPATGELGARTARELASASGIPLD